MSEAMFRVGGVYRNKAGELQKIARIPDASESDAVARAIKRFLDRGFSPCVVHFVNKTTGEVLGCTDGWRDLATGLYPDCKDNDEYGSHLLPGELTFVNGEWISMTPTLDKLEAEKEEAAVAPQAASPDFLEQLRDLLRIQGMDGTWNSDGYMCGLYNGLELALATAEGRDPQYRSLKPAPAPVSTAKPAISGLTRMSAGDHRLGLGRTFG